MTKLKTLEKEHQRLLKEIPQANKAYFGLNKYEIAWEKAKEDPSYQRKIERTKKVEEACRKEDQQHIEFTNVYIKSMQIK